MNTYITHPVKKLGYSYEDNLVKNLIKDLIEEENEISHFLEIKEINLSILQIVCQHLWEKNKDNNNKVITYKSYSDLGGIEEVKLSHIDRVINQLPIEEKSIAVHILETLAPYQLGAKAYYTSKSLIKLIKSHKNKANTVLKKLSKNKIINHIRKKEENWYSLIHDDYIKIFHKWYEEKALKKNKNPIELETYIKPPNIRGAHYYLRKLGENFEDIYYCFDRGDLTEEIFLSEVNKEMDSLSEDYPYQKVSIEKTQAPSSREKPNNILETQRNLYIKVILSKNPYWTYFSSRLFLKENDIIYEFQQAMARDTALSAWDLAKWQKFCLWHFGKFGNLPTSAANWKRTAMQLGWDGSPDNGE